MFYHFDVAQIKSICAENINYYALMATAEVNVTVSGNTIVSFVTQWENLFKYVIYHTNYTRWDIVDKLI